MAEQIQDSLGDQRKSMLSKYDTELQSPEAKANPYDFTNSEVEQKIKNRIQKTLEVD
jgi:hypothetical protein